MNTPHRAIRIPADLWQPALSVAAERNENLSDIIRAALVAYINAWGTTKEQA